MPPVNVKAIEGVFSSARKQEMIRKLTDALVSMGEDVPPVTRLAIEEVRSGDWGIGGLPITTETVQAMAAGRAVA